MGRREKVDQRMHEAAARELAHDETLTGALSVMRFVPMWPVALALFAVSFALSMNGYELRSWVTGAAIGLYIGIAWRAYYWIQTNQRVILVRPGFWSPKKATFESAIPLTSIHSATIKDGFASDRLSVTTTEGKTLRFTIIRQWEEDAQKLVRSLTHGSMFRPDGSNATETSQG